MHHQHFTALAKAAILAGPQTAAPPAYNGVGWLVVLNLGVMTACTWVGGMAITGLIRGLVRYRASPFDHPANLLRRIALLAAICFTFRCGAEAVQLWAWNPRDVDTSAWARTMKHFVDPIAVTSGLASIALAVLSWKSLMKHLSKEPWPMPLWTKWRMLIQPAVVVVLGFVAAAAVVAFR